MNIKAISAVVLASTMAFGMNVAAASSSTTSNTAASTIVENQENYVVYRNSTTTATRAAVVKTTEGKTVRVVSDYAEVTSPKMIATVTKADKATAEALKAYVDTDAAGKTVLVSGIRVRMYEAGKSLTDGFGTFNAKIGVGAKYNGKTATAYIYSIDGTVTKVAVTIVNGQAIIPMAKMGVVTLVLD